MKWSTGLAVVAVLVLSVESVHACGGGSGSLARGGFSGKGFGGVPIASNVGMAPVAMANARMNMARQASIAQANAYNARMRPIRIANAMKVREAKLAAREARKAVNIAKLQERRRLETEEREFLVKARTWTDRSGEHQLVAIPVGMSGTAIKLQKRDQSIVSVPLESLSGDDQTWVAARVPSVRSLITPTTNGIVLVGTSR